jgi:uncharacterized protein YraI
MVNVTATPDFFTATLPPTPMPQATQSPTQPAPLPIPTEAPNLPPVEGMTTTQVNVRAAPSTASASLGLISIFAKVQITGRDTSGSWYQIVYAESEAGKGWVRAEYVQVDAKAEIQLVETASGSGSVVNGIVLQKVNVRSGPDIASELLGVLNSNDLVFITGRDAESKWIQIEFASAPDGKGWVTAEFLQAENLESVPQLGVAAEATPVPTDGNSTPTASAKMAVQDGDSMQSPLARVVFSATGSRALQLQGDVSAPDGDMEDWVQFTSQGDTVSIEVTCPIRTELWNNGNAVGNFPCGGASLAKVTPGKDYFLRLIQNGSGYTDYILNLEGVR